MNIKASGRSALVLATGIWLGFAGPTFAAPGVSDGDASPASANATSEDTAQPPPLALVKTPKHASHHLKKVAHRKTGDKQATKKKAAVAEATPDESDNLPAAQSKDIPPTVANANAQFPASDASADSAKAMSDRASTILQAAPADPQAATATAVVAADQLNDVDRALRENTAPAVSQAAAAVPMTVASADTAGATASPATATAASDKSSTWDQTSLIGKIFIGFGAALTMASAARMFMA